MLSFLLLALALAAPGAAAAPSVPPAVVAADSTCRVDPVTGERSCCRICRRGCACGNSCIPCSRTCRVGRGCACNAGEPGGGGASSPAPAAPTRAETLLLQRQLSRLGHYRGALDGADGPATRAAVRAFQRAEGLEPDGVAGAETRRRLRERSGIQ